MSQRLKIALAATGLPFLGGVGYALTFPHFETRYTSTSKWGLPVTTTSYGRSGVTNLQKMISTTIDSGREEVKLTATVTRKDLVWSEPWSLLFPQRRSLELSLHWKSEDMLPLRREWRSEARCEGGQPFEAMVKVELTKEQEVEAIKARGRIQEMTMPVLNDLHTHAEYATDLL